MLRSCDSTFKSRVALAALRDDKTIAEIAGEFQVYPNQVLQWKMKLVGRSGESSRRRANARRKTKGIPRTI